MKNKPAVFFIAVIIAADFILPRIAMNMANKSAIPIEFKLCIAGVVLVLFLLSVL